MEKADSFCRSDFVYRDDAVMVFHCVLCAMGRFYADDRGWLDRSVSRERLITRIVCSLSSELDFAGFRPRYVPDLIRIGGLLNIGIRSRIGAENPLALSVCPPERSGLKLLHALCGSSGPDRYRLAVSLGLGRRSYRATWVAAEAELKRETERNFSRWAGTAPFLCVSGTDVFIPGCTRPVSDAASGG